MSPTSILLLVFLTLLGTLQAVPPQIPLIPAEVLRADFEELYTRLQASHFNLYARRDRASYDRKFRSMRQSFRHPISRTQALAAFQTFLAYGRVAHARMEEPDSGYETYRAEGGRALPFRLRVAEGRVYIGANLSGLDTLKRGDEILTLNGKPVSQHLSAFHTFISADNDRLLHALVELEGPRLFWRLLGSVQSFNLSVRRGSGKARLVKVPARSQKEMNDAASVQPDGLNVDWMAREAKCLPQGVAYLRPGPFFETGEDGQMGWDPTAFTQFLDKAFCDFLKAGSHSLLVDLRCNPGGDNSFSDPMVAWFATRPFCFTSGFRIKVSAATTASNAARLAASPAGSISHQYAQLFATHKPGEVVRFEMPLVQPRSGAQFAGKVYLLVNRHSYSNTVTTAALVQDYGFGKILGEETADLATTYGAMERFRLSRTGFQVGYPKAQILRPSGNTSPRGVIPDLPIRTPVVETAEDSVLQKALEAIRLEHPNAGRS